MKTDIPCLFVVFLIRQPLVHDKLVSVPCLHIPHNDGAAEPRGVIIAAGVVVPKAEVLEAAQGSTININLGICTWSKSVLFTD